MVGREQQHLLGETVGRAASTWWDAWEAASSWRDGSHFGRPYANGWPWLLRASHSSGQASIPVP